MSLEVERKFALAHGQELPALEGLGDPEHYDLRATYYDTRHFALTRARQVVRHRLGGSDDGWHVKLPGADAEHRTEHHAPPQAPRLPAELRALVAATLAGEALLPVAEVHSRRRQAELRDADGRVLAFVCTDDVHATTVLGTAGWREAEVELVEGDLALLDELTARLARSGIHPAAGQSKIVRTLAEAIEADDAAQAAGPDAAGVVLDYFSHQVGTLQDLEAGVLADDPDAVHRSRVATRRLRTALRTFRPLFDRHAVAELREELAWHAAELGAPRDAEVLRDGLLQALDNLAVPGDAPERESITRSLHEAHDTAHAELRETMATPRYDTLQARLARWLAEPPLAQADPGPATAILHGLLDRARGRIATLYTRALRDPGDPSGWHEVRKAAKAARYCSEALEPVFGARAEQHADAWEAVTDALGELQDSVVARTAIASLAGDSTVAQALVAYEVGRGRAELARGRKALDAALAQSL